MEQIERFNLAVTTLTVAIMFIFLEYVTPLFKSSELIVSLSTWLPWISTDKLLAALKIIATALISIGTYKIISQALVVSLEFVPLLKRWVFGPSYVEGTWIGRFYSHGQQKITVEHFVQGLGGIVIRGWAYNDDGTTYADWSSDSVAVDAKTGNIRYSYDCNVMLKNTPQEGIGRFKVTQAGLFKNPKAIKGYSADLTDGSRSENDETNISRSLVDLQRALATARAKFR